MATHQIPTAKAVLPGLALLVALLPTLAGCGDEVVIPEPTNRPDGGGAVDAGDTSAVDSGGPDDGVGDVTVDGDASVDTAGDVPVDVAPDSEPPVDEAPRVVNAFSQGDDTIVVRFSETIDTVTGSVADNYRVEGSDNTRLPVASVAADDKFAFLTLDLSSVSINPDLTYTVLVTNVEDTTGNVVDSRANLVTVRRSLYLNIIWHQHQPLYHDPISDQMIGPWVRKHATKDYWDMTAILQQYEDIHLTVNLTSVLLIQNALYVERLGPYYDAGTNRIREDEFLAEYEGKTDPFIDLLLHDTPTPEDATEEELGLFWMDPWATVSTSDAIMQRFPEYVALRDADRSRYSQLDFAHLKIWFEIAWFDPDFLQGPVALTNGYTVDLSDVVDLQSDGTYRLASRYTLADAGSEAELLARLEDLANRLVAENYKIMSDVVPLHQSLIFDPEEAPDGQIQVITTPFFHPILPLIYDSDLARYQQPTDLLPNRFAWPDDAYTQVALARRFYEDTFGITLRGMWPGEGSVAEEIVDTLVSNGIEWVATDQTVLANSQPSGQPHWRPYQIDSDTVTGAGGDTSDALAIVFRDTELSNKIGFTYQTWRGRDAAEDFIEGVLAQAPRFGQDDRLLTVILDGENAWELYRLEHDGKGFQHALYQILEESQSVGEIVTVTPSEYIHGNLERGVAAHAIPEMAELEPLSRGSWIDGTYATWIGESEENLAWNYLSRARSALYDSGLPPPNPLVGPPARENEEDYAIYSAWMSMYAAEGSDWFWWYGDDQTSASNDDTPFDRAFRNHLRGTFQWMNDALALRGEDEIEVPEFGPIIQPRAEVLRGPFDPAPVINGQFDPDETEWGTAGGSFFDNDSSGTIASPTDHIQRVYYGYDRIPGSPDDEALYVAIVFNQDISAQLGENYRVAVYTNYKHITNPDLGQFEPDPPIVNTVSGDGVDLNFFGGGAGWMIDIGFQSGSATVTRHQASADSDGVWEARDLGGIELGGPVAGGRLLELRIPWSALGMTFGDPFEFMVVAYQADEAIDQAPQLESKVVFDDITNLVTVVFRVDVSGATIPIDQFTNINTPPPPPATNRGIVYITGNQDALNSFEPNVVALADDGTGADETAGDYVWSRSFQFRPGEIVQWKYTIGTPSDEGRWAGTEEYPLTNRCYTLPGTPTTVILNEIFADRPVPDCTLAPNTVVETEGE